MDVSIERRFELSNGTRIALVASVRSLNTESHAALTVADHEGIRRELKAAADAAEREIRQVATPAVSGNQA